jgi:hypothetical protein
MQPTATSQLRFRHGDASAVELQAVVDEVLAELRDQASEAAEQAQRAGLDAEAVAAASINVREEQQGLDPLATTILVTIAPGLGSHMAIQLWDQVIWPRLRRRLGAKALREVASIPASGYIPDSNDGRARIAAHPYEVQRYSSSGVRLTIILARPYPQAAEEVQPVVDDVISVDAYLDTDDMTAARRVLDALDELAGLLGYEIPTDEEIHRGSFWRSAKAALHRGFAHDEVRNRLIKVERALELVGIEERQASVDVKTAEAVEKLISGLQDIPQACMRAGSLLLVKYQDHQGPVLLVRSMSQLEVRAFERFPEIQQDPRATIEALATAISNLEPTAWEVQSGIERS